MRVAVFDLDGCVSCDCRRRKFLPAEGSSDSAYNMYHQGLANDEAKNVGMILGHISRGDHLLFITARPERYIGDTLFWLKEIIGQPDRFTLLMRPNGDSRPSAQLKVDWLRFWLRDAKASVKDVVAAYDDRRDVLEAYAAFGIPKERLHHLTCCEQEEEPRAPAASSHKPRTADEILTAMAATYRERNAVYGDNFRTVAPTIAALFPNGVPSELVTTDRWHLFELIIVKLSRFAQSNLTHTDSIHDAGVYAAMIEADISAWQPDGGEK